MGVRGLVMKMTATEATPTFKKAKCGHDRPHCAYGLCQPCYARLRYHLDPADREMRKQTNLARYHANKAQ